MRFLLSALLSSSAVLISQVHAASIMFDFGPTTVAGADLVNSPWHTVDPAAGTSWNKVTGTDNNAVPDVTSGLVFSDGSGAAGVGLNFGVSSTAALQNLNLATQPTRVSNLGGVYSTGIYGGTSVGRDAIFLTNSWAIGGQVTGLAAGTYDIYLTARNTTYNTNDYKQTAYAGAGVAGSNFDYSGYFNSTVTYLKTSTAPNSWVQGETYMKLTVTLSEGQALNFAVIGENAGAVDRGFLNSLQIVSVPEPSAALLGIGALGVMAVRRRRA